MYQQQSPIDKLIQVMMVMIVGSAGMGMSGPMMIQGERYYWGILSKDTGEIMQKSVPYSSIKKAILGAVNFILYDLTYVDTSARRFLIEVYDKVPEPSFERRPAPLKQVELNIVS